MSTFNAKDNEIIDGIKKLGAKHDNLIAFSDFVEITACAISKPFFDRDNQYFAIQSRYSDDEMRMFQNMAFHLIEYLEEEPQDILGQIYMNLNIANKQRGQCFTPLCISELMAKASIEIEKKEKIYRINDPSCGSGALIIGTIKSLINCGMNPNNEVFATASDLDRKSVMMCYIQLSLLGVPAIITHGNTLTGEIFEQWKTPLYYLKNKDKKPEQLKVVEVPDILK